jgi:3-deoxy-7-phosphoheptulonate synthase
VKKLFHWIVLEKKINNMQNKWSPDSWKNFVANQQVIYKDNAHFERNLKKISTLPTIINFEKIQQCILDLKNVKEKNHFLLQIGECSESFKEFGQDYIDGYIKFIREISASLNLTTVNIARLGGQFAKPRTSLTEENKNITLSNYRGDMINDSVFSMEGREPDPDKLLEAYAQSSLTANLTIDEFYLSHEALILDYEQQFIKKNAAGEYYSSSAHLLWIGKRTNFIDSAHIEFVSGLSNPVGIKIDHNFDLEELELIINKIGYAPGKLVIIGRFGINFVEEKIISLVKLLKKYKNIIYICDPMHGNAYINENNIKTRNIDDILTELKITIIKLKEHNLTLNGVMLEAYFNYISECLGVNIDQNNLGKIYTSNCDPRLNPQQTKEIINNINQLLAC